MVLAACKSHTYVLPEQGPARPTSQRLLCLKHTAHHSLAALTLRQQVTKFGGGSRQTTTKFCVETNMHDPFEMSMIHPECEQSHWLIQALHVTQI